MSIHNLTEEERRAVRKLAAIGVDALFETARKIELAKKKTIRRL